MNHETGHATAEPRSSCNVTSHGGAEKRDHRVRSLMAAGGGDGKTTVIQTTFPRGGSGRESRDSQRSGERKRKAASLQRPGAKETTTATVFLLRGGLMDLLKQWGHGAVQQ